MAMPSQTSPHFKFLGDLERAVMEHLWTEGPADAKAVHRAIGRRRGITLNTVQSTLKRLREKGILERRKIRHAYVYETLSDRRTFGCDVLGDVIGELMDGKADAMISAFVDLTERAGEEQLKRLEELVTHRLGRRGEGGAA
jgi:predicted transcriptional regulator